MLTVATSPNTSRPSFFDIAGRAKWDAWTLAAQTYEGRPSEAEHRYLDIAQSLGWKEGASAATSAAAEDETEEEQGERGGGGGGGSGMGISVSVISPPILDKVDDSPGLHGYAMGDDVAAISAFLSANEAVDINGRDEYVSLFYHTPPISSHATGGVISYSSLHISVTVVLYTNRGTPRFTWPPIGETSPRSSFYSSKVPIRHSR